tara:strand:+ start:870 stop:1268 length:399 start_codon:yes stop_codon:yes gene_type:complete
MSFDNHPHAADLARLRKLAQKMDSAFRVPVLGVRVGWDSVFGLVPVVGDALTLAPSVFILRESRRLGASKPVMARMGVNVGIDLAIGAIPLLGDLFDIGWRSNTRNVDLLHTHLAKQAKMDKSVDTSLPDTA